MTSYRHKHGLRLRVGRMQVPMNIAVSCVGLHITCNLQVHYLLVIIGLIIKDTTFLDTHGFFSLLLNAVKMLN